LEVVRPLPGAAPKHAAAAPAPAPRAEPAPEPTPTPALEPFALIEPGDEAAASIAISARESLREANG
jgi:chemosensory pili system protein ChpA (sensor histidine kinase/response regulator)